MSGNYTIEYYATAPLCSWIVAPGFKNPSKAPLFKGDYTMEVEVANVQSTQGNYVVGYLFNVQPNYDSLLRFGINQTGSWYLWKQAGKMVQEVVLARGRFDPVDFLHGTHVLKLRVEGGKYLLGVDNQSTPWIAADTQFTDGTIGLAFGGNDSDQIIFARAEFDNLVVRELN
jgi:hypothetical protein